MGTSLWGEDSAEVGQEFGEGRARATIPAEPLSMRGIKGVSPPRIARALLACNSGCVALYF